MYRTSQVQNQFGPYVGVCTVLGLNPVWTVCRCEVRVRDIASLRIQDSAAGGWENGCRGIRWIAYVSQSAGLNLGKRHDCEIYLDLAKTDIHVGSWM
jgi:hypothetical protein